MYIHIYIYDRKWRITETWRPRGARKGDDGPSFNPGTPCGSEVQHGVASGVSRETRTKKRHRR